jgi:hypothetical protein
MAEDALQDSGPTLHGPLDNPFESWPNSDLLLEPADRAFFERHFARYAPLLDWPEARRLFQSFNGNASDARRRSRRGGIAAVLLGYSSLLLTASMPMADGRNHHHEATSGLSLPLILSSLAALLVIFSVYIGSRQILRGKNKARWLANRFCAERVRQLHFQLIVNNLPAFVAAAQSDHGRAQWMALRATALDIFGHEHLRDVDDRIQMLKQDEAEDRPWLSESWDTPPAVPPQSPELSQTFALLDRQRFGIQQQYAEKKLAGGWRSPQSWSQWVPAVSDSLSAILLLATMLVAAGAIWEMSADHHATPWLRLIAAFVAALCSSTIVGIRALKEGLLFSADSARYTWYLATVRNLRRRFEHADDVERVRCLRELESAAYREMRRFILSAVRTRFVI